MPLATKLELVGVAAADEDSRKFKEQLGDAMAGASGNTQRRTFSRWSWSWSSCQISRTWNGVHFIE